MDQSHEIDLWSVLKTAFPRKAAEFGKTLEKIKFPKQSNFPQALLLRSPDKYPVPAVPFAETGSEITPRLRELEIFVDPKISFQAGV